MTDNQPDIYTNTDNIAVATSQPRVYRTNLKGVHPRETVKVQLRANPKRIVSIAKDEFDPAVHKRISKENGSEAKAKAKAGKAVLKKRRQTVDDDDE